MPVATSAPAVAFGDGRRPEAATRVTLPAFDGPLALLLALIEARQLDVLTVPLGALADAYLDALATLDADRMGNVSAFISVASQLILIKSRAMLPRHKPEGPIPLADEGPDPESELRARLILYRAFRDAGARLLAQGQARMGLWHREPTTARAAVSVSVQARASSSATAARVPEPSPRSTSGTWRSDSTSSALPAATKGLGEGPTSTTSSSANGWATSTRSLGRRPTSARSHSRAISDARARADSDTDTRTLTPGWLSRSRARNEGKRYSPGMVEAATTTRPRCPWLSARSCSSASPRSASIRSA